MFGSETVSDWKMGNPFLVGLKALLLFTFFLFFPNQGRSASTDTAKFEVLSVKDFPLNIGSQWIYLHVDSLASGYPYPQKRTEQVVVETVTVTIVRQLPLEEGRRTTVWIREFGSKIDTQYVTLFGDTLSFSVRARIYTDTTKPLVEREVARFVFPLKVGKTWKSPVTYAQDTFVVSRKDSIKVIQDEFRHGFLVERSWWIPNEGGDIAYWIVPNVGLAKMKDHYFFTIANEQRNQIWRLISYDIKK